MKRRRERVLKITGRIFRKNKNENEKEDEERRKKKKERGVK